MLQKYSQELASYYVRLAKKTGQYWYQPVSNSDCIFHDADILVKIQQSMTIRIFSTYS